MAAVEAGNARPISEELKRRRDKDSSNGEEKRHRRSRLLRSPRRDSRRWWQGAASRRACRPLFPNSYSQKIFLLPPVRAVSAKRSLRLSPRCAPRASRSSRSRARRSRSSTIRTPRSGRWGTSTFSCASRATSPARRRRSLGAGWRALFDTPRHRVFVAARRTGRAAGGRGPGQPDSRRNPHVVPTARSRTRLRRERGPARRRRKRATSTALPSRSRPDPRS